MNTNESIVILSTCFIAFIHTITGPDHYVPIGVFAKLKKWNLKKALWFTFFAGLGHITSSVIIGVVGIVLGISINKINIWEEVRGSIVSVLFFSFGFIYFIYGIISAVKNKPHKHSHFHNDGTFHEHEHVHNKEHIHFHDEEKSKLTAWIFFIIFIFGPCEPLIPLVMYPAANNNIFLLIFVTSLFALITILTMMILVFAIYKGLNLKFINKYIRYNNLIIGATILLCGAGMVFFGL
ncbi:MAG: sulfite exporter TauE/SafE family protein [Bacteroidales bacterium]|nr:sulfite exporter TauE/SafE family protein [Bacteroidales bacterium]